MQLDLSVDVGFDIEQSSQTAPISSVVDRIAAPAAISQGAAVVLHLRFAADASVWLIDECPPELSGQQWFNLLCARFGDKYSTRAGGRGFFRLTRAELDAVKARPN